MVPLTRAHPPRCQAGERLEAARDVDRDAQVDEPSVRREQAQHPVRAAPDAAAGRPPVRRPADAHLVAAPCVDERDDVRRIHPEHARVAAAGDERRRVRQLVDDDVRRAEDRHERRLARTDESRLVERAVVGPRVGQQHVADTLAAQPRLVGVRAEGLVVEQLVLREVALAVPAAHDRDAGVRQIRRRPVLGRVHRLDPVRRAEMLWRKRIAGAQYAVVCAGSAVALFAV